jgi:hypothetical protein
MGPGCEIWSHFADSGLISFLKGEMLKPINCKYGVSCPTAAPLLSHCLPTTIFRYLLVFQLFTLSWSHFLLFFYKQMYAGMKKYF